MNTYLSQCNNPVKYTDPSGKMDEETVLAKIIDNINKGDVLYRKY